MTARDDVAVVAGVFATAFGGEPDLVVRSPGRVNLIGDHTDYNDGFVFPIAIAPSMWIAGRLRKDRLLRGVSVELGPASNDLAHLARSGGWMDYVAGVVRELGEGVSGGLDLAVHSRIPAGAGLSSSAALELGVARLVTGLAGLPWDPVSAARLARRAENEFVGVPSGIMDQLVVATAVAGHALLIDCRTLDSVPYRLPTSVQVVVLDTGTRRRLVASAYEERRRTCEAAAGMLGVPALRDATVDDLARIEFDDAMYRRARHVVYENDRVIRAAGAVRRGEVDAAGMLMNESHASLRDDFEVSGEALDRITDIARGHVACHGARMTGGGSAGCGVALVQREGVNDFVEHVQRVYDASSPNRATLHVTEPAGAVAIV